MELRHFEYFVAVADEGNFTRAAVREHVVQSAVSAAIHALEAELGARLFERSSKRVALTDAGSALLPRARQVLDAARAARDAVDEVRGGIRGSLAIGTMTSIGRLDLPSLLGRFHRRHPAVEVRLVVAAQGTRGLVEQLLAGALDLAIVSLPGPVPPGLARRRLASMPLALVVAQEHRLAGRASVPLAELGAEPFVDFPVGYGCRVVVDHAFALAELRRRVAVEAAEFGMAVAIVRQGLGVAILPGFAADGVEGVRALPIADADLSWPLDVATPTSRTATAAARAFLALLGEESIDARDAALANTGEG